MGECQTRNRARRRCRRRSCTYARSTRSTSASGAPVAGAPVQERQHQGLHQSSCSRGRRAARDSRAASHDQPDLRVVVRSTDPKTGFSQTRAVSVLASTPEAAEQAAQAQVQANKWKGDWVAAEVSPTTGAAIPYTEKGETNCRTRNYCPRGRESCTCSYSRATRQWRRPSSSWGCARARASATWSRSRARCWGRSGWTWRRGGAWSSSCRDARCRHPYRSA